MNKKAWCTCNIVVLPTKPIAILTFTSPLSSDFKRYLKQRRFWATHFFSVIKTIYPRVWTKPLPNAAKSPLPVDTRLSKSLLLNKLPNNARIVNSFPPSLWTCHVCLKRSPLVSSVGRALLCVDNLVQRQGKAPWGTRFLRWAGESLIQTSSVASSRLFNINQQGHAADLWFEILSDFMTPNTRHFLSFKKPFLLPSTVQKPFCFFYSISMYDTYIDEERTQRYIGSKLCYN